MHPKLYAALKAQTEARMAFNALPEDADDAAITEARRVLSEADQAVIEAFEAGDGAAPAELRDRISLGRYLTALAADGAADGAEAELRQELGLSDQAIPLEAMLPTPEERLETRADAVSPQGTDGNALSFGGVNQTTGPLLTRIFTQTDTAFLGVAMPTVPPGERVYPVMTDGTTAAMAARGAEAADAGAAKFDVVNATPHRLSGRYVFDLEGVATLGGMLESTLRADLRLAMGFALDSQILGGDGTGANVSGLLKQLTLEAPPGAAGAFNANDVALLNWQGYREIFTMGLDGKYARMESDIRLLIGTDTYNIARNSFRAGNNAERDAIESAAAIGGRSRHSFMLPAPAVATISPKNANSSKKVQSAIRATENAAVAPVWQGITMIRDPYSAAGKAQVILTAHMLYDFILRRKDGWKRYAIRTEA